MGDKKELNTDGVAYIQGGVDKSEANEVYPKDKIVVEGSGSAKPSSPTPPVKEQSSSVSKKEEKKSEEAKGKLVLGHRIFFVPGERVNKRFFSVGKEEKKKFYQLLGYDNAQKRNILVHIESASDSLDKDEAKEILNELGEVKTSQKEQEVVGDDQRRINNMEAGQRPEQPMEFPNETAAKDYYEEKYGEGRISFKEFAGRDHIATGEVLVDRTKIDEVSYSVILLSEFVSRRELREFYEKKHPGKMVVTDEGDVRSRAREGMKVFLDNVDGEPYTVFVLPENQEV